MFTIVILHFLCPLIRKINVVLLPLFCDELRQKVVYFLARNLLDSYWLLRDTETELFAYSVRISQRRKNKHNRNNPNNPNFFFKSIFETNCEKWQQEGFLPDRA